MAEKSKEETIVSVMEYTPFILNEIKATKIKELEKTKLTPNQQKVVDNIKKDIDVCVTKLGLILHTSEL